MASTPAAITQAEVDDKLQRTARYINFAEALATDEERYRFDKNRFAKVMAALELLFRADPTSKS